jgi:hypothetical protein
MYTIHIFFSCDDIVYSLKSRLLIGLFWFLLFSISQDKFNINAITLFNLHIEIGFIYFKPKYEKNNVNIVTNRMMFGVDATRTYSYVRLRAEMINNLWSGQKWY